MRRLLLILTSLLILVVSSSGQAVYTTVTATLTDSSTQVWAGATIIASLRPAPNNPAVPLNNGLPITDSPQTAIADGTGTFSLILDSTNKVTPAGALWTFSIYPNATVSNGNSISLPITGTTVNLSGVLSSILTVPNVFAAPSVNRAYSNSEVNGGAGGIYWNTTSNTLNGCIFSLGICTWQTIGNLSTPGSHYYIPYNNGSSGFTASVNLQFNDTTNTLSSLNGIFNNNLTVINNLVAGFFISDTANSATTGAFNLASTDKLCWRNNANNADICWVKNSSDQFTPPGSLLNATLISPTISNPSTTGTDSGSETLVNKSLTSPNISSPNTVGVDIGLETLSNKTLASPNISGTPTGSGLQGTDTKLITSGYISGTANTCIDGNGGITNSGCVTIASFNAPQRVVLGSPVGPFSTQTIILTELVTFPSAAGTYRADVRYGIWISGNNTCHAEVIDTTNSHAYAMSGPNSNGGTGALTASEISSYTYAASATATFTVQAQCTPNGTAVVNDPVFTFSPAEASYLSVTPVLTNS